VLLQGLLDDVVVAVAVAALAVVPARIARGLLVGIDLLGNGLTAVHAMATVQGIELILLNDVDELCRVVGVLGIAAVTQALGPAAVIGHVKLVQDAVAWPLQELGVIQEGILRRSILAVAHLLEGVASAIDLTLPVISLDAKVVVGLAGHLALADAALQDALCQRDAGRYAKFLFMLQGDALIAIDVV